MIEIEIDGKKFEAEPGSMIIEVADKVGIPIPRFCYHKKLSIAANCRMCLIEVEKAPKPLPACATPVTPGMKIFTCSQKAREAQKAVMEFLLINHPLDCPICDQGGECELQDLSLTYGKGISRFVEGKRSVKDDDLGSLIATEMTRCIQCTRCVRFETEVAGFRELGATGRGENMEITTYIKHSVKHEMSGNIIDLCPVGALTSKPYRFTARPWELDQVASIAPHDCIGSNIYVHKRSQDIMRVVPRDNEAINESWLSDRDRFSYTAVNSSDRLHKPMIKINDVWQETDWVTALEFAAQGLQTVLEHYGPKQLGALISPSATTEELFLLQKLMRGLGSHTIDHRLHQTDFSDQKSAPLYPNLGISIAEIETQDLILLIGSNIQREQPIAAHCVRKAVSRGAKVISLNAVDYPINFNLHERIITMPDNFGLILAGIIKAWYEQSATEIPAAMATLLQGIQSNAREKALAEQLRKGNNKLILLGAVAQNLPEASAVRILAQWLANLCGAKLGCLTTGANSAGAWIAGAVPHRGPAGATLPDSGLSAHTALTSSLRAYFLFGIEPELDCTNPAAVTTSLAKAEFIIAFSPFKAASLLQHANVILPIATFTETAGTFVNVEGRWQSFSAVVNPPAEVRPGWKVLRVLANQLQIAGFDYASAEEIRDELIVMMDNASIMNSFSIDSEGIKNKLERRDKAHKVMRITEWPIYSVDSVVRRAQDLQDSATCEPTAVYMNAGLAERLNLTNGTLVQVMQGAAKTELPLMVDARIADGCVWIPAARAETAVLGAAFGTVEVNSFEL